MRPSPSIARARAAPAGPTAAQRGRYNLPPQPAQFAGWSGRSRAPEGGPCAPREGGLAPTAITPSSGAVFLSPQLLPDHAQALLALADGTVFHGASIGAEGETTGEVVFNTALTGYQEILTDPSYCRQIVTLTYPHIGSYGSNPEDVESARVHAAGLVVKDVPPLASNFRSTATLERLPAQGKHGRHRRHRHAPADAHPSHPWRPERLHRRPAARRGDEPGPSRCGSGRGALGTVDVGTRPGQGRQRRQALRLDPDDLGARPRLRRAASAGTSCRGLRLRRQVQHPAHAGRARLPHHGRAGDDAGRRRAGLAPRRRLPGERTGRPGAVRLRHRSDAPVHREGAADVRHLPRVIRSWRWPAARAPTR